ncbi:YceI family protein [Halioxenophilus sp. WMMB6]|uniref:YceI family protein n=1 Tax=Halioxenophilus sp. WMMB6 TaxID=3073815 RepID=UPI00295E3E53|nr:YceI family protein [Halioxenophilus sp. WMMB6]
MKSISRRMFASLALVMVALFSSGVWADMALDSERSSLTFITTKNGAITEVHRFTGLSGSIDKAGVATVSIDLISVATGIEVRDQRMRSMLFETEKFATATITANVNAVMDSIKKSSSKTVEIPAQLSLHGVTQDITLQVLVTHGRKNWVVSAVTPVMIKAEDFGLAAGVEKLREVAGLSTISQMVPVSFVLTFDK